MKLKLFIIALLMSVTVYSQRNISMSTEIEKYVASFVEEGHKRGLPILDSLFNKVDYIIL